MKRAVLGCCCGVVLGLAFGLGGCAPGGHELPDSLDPVLAFEFAPASLRISPLTRLEVGTDGKPELAVYFELADRWGHATKAPGVVQIQLYRLGGVSQGLATLVGRWEADMVNPSQNSELFDVTGMYRVPLAELPGWLAQRADGEGKSNRVRLRVFLRTIGVGGATIDLRDTFENDF